MPHVAGRDVVVALVHLGQEEGGVGGIVLEVGVQGDDDLAAGAVETGRKRRRLAEVPAQADDLDPRVGGLETLEGRIGPVLAPVVDEDHLVAPAERVGGGRELPVQVGDVLLFVEDRDDERDVEDAGRDHRRQYITIGFSPPST